MTDLFKKAKDEAEKKRKELEKEREKQRKKMEKERERLEREREKEREKLKERLDRERENLGKATGIQLPNTPAEALDDTIKDLQDGKPIDDALRSTGIQVSKDAEGIVRLSQIPDYIALKIGEEALGDIGRVIMESTHGRKILLELMAVEALKQLTGASQEGFELKFLETPEGQSAAALAACIIMSRDYYLELKSTTPLSSTLKERLKNGFDIELLDAVRVAQSDVFDLALPGSSNAGKKFFEGHEHAVTVDNVIVFSKIPPESVEHLEWWAHEIYHTQQYKEWGVTGFAKRYIEDWGAVEAKATEQARKIIDLILQIEKFKLGRGDLS